VDSDRIKGKKKELEGEAQQKWGEAKDRARRAWEDAKDRSREETDEARDHWDAADDDLVEASRSR
jgi:F0F1-type ATP synthase membrane subunit b/b'